MKVNEFKVGETAGVTFPNTKKWPKILRGKSALGTVTKINRKSISISGKYGGCYFNVLRRDGQGKAS